MKDAWGKFGAGCLGFILGAVVTIEFMRDEMDDRQADNIVERLQRTFDFHFDGWRKKIEEARSHD